MRIYRTVSFVLLATFVAGCASSNVNDVPPTSSYRCQSAQVSRSSVTGEGMYGCHFYLHNPETHQLLANTAYRIDIYPAPANGGNPPLSIFTAEGKTDAAGRSGYVRAAFPLTPDRVKFVEQLGSGRYSMTPRLIRPTDGLAIPDMIYIVEWCGKTYTGTTDEQGNGAAFSTPVPCEVNVKFYAKP